MHQVQINKDDIEKRIQRLEKDTTTLVERVDRITEEQTEHALLLASIQDDITEQRDISDEVIKELKQVKKSLEPSYAMKFGVLVFSIVWIIALLSRFLLDT